MILRRVIAHFRKQEWTAIAIDFVIVVAGVFIGIQVSNWNEARKIRDGERRWMLELRDDMAADIAFAHNHLRYLGDVMTAQRRALAFLAEDKPCEVECWRTLVDFFAASQRRDLSKSRVSLAELAGSPYPYDQDFKRRLKDNYSNKLQIAEIVTEPEFRILVRELIPIAAQGPMWTTCHRGGGDQQEIMFDCPPAISPAAVREALERVRANPRVEPTLNFYASMLTHVTRLLSEETAKSEAILVELDRKLGAHS